MEELFIKDIRVEIIKKNIKNVHLSVYPPDGRVRISIPLRYDRNILKVFILSKLNWIKEKQEKFRNQVREEPREFIDRESYFYKGERYLLKTVERKGRNEVSIEANQLVVYIKQGQKRNVKKIIENWYRQELKELIPIFIQKWERVLNVKVAEFGIKKMKTRWGTCNIKDKRIWLNLELIKKPIECLDYVVLHEVAHLLEKHHNKKFISILDKAMPNWRQHKQTLNNLPAKAER